MKAFVKAGVSRALGVLLFEGFGSGHGQPQSFSGKKFPSYRQKVPTLKLG